MYSIPVFIFLYLNILIKKNNSPFIIVQMAEKMMQILIFFKKWRKKREERNLIYAVFRARRKYLTKLTLTFDLKRTCFSKTSKWTVIFKGSQ